MLIKTCFNTPFGVFEVVYDEQFIHAANFLSPDSMAIYYENLDRPSMLAKQINSALLAYSLNGHYQFHLPYKLCGTAFQQRVWQGLEKIAPGQVMTYGELANVLGTSARAIGQACRTNPISLFIPCHRVIAQSNWGGYMGKKHALNIKQQLLTHEKSTLPFIV